MDSLKIWQNSDLWERQKQIKIASVEALQEYLIRGILLSSEFRIFAFVRVV
jgi:hypothetical protein